MSAPGKFEGEPDYVEVFWGLALGGRADQNLDGTYVFHITDEVHQEFPELPVGSRLFLVEGSDGCVYSRVVGVN